MKSIFHVLKYVYFKLAKINSFKDRILSFNYFAVLFICISQARNITQENSKYIDQEAHINNCITLTKFQALKIHIGIFTDLKLITRLQVVRFYDQSNVQGKRIVGARDIFLTRASYIVRYNCEI